MSTGVEAKTFPPPSPTIKATSEGDIPSISVIIVESLIAVLVVVAGFEYDRWRAKSSTFTVYERFAVLFIFAVSVYALVYYLLHRRMSVFGVVYRAPLYGE